MKYEVPELSGLSKKSALYTLNRFLRGGGPKDHVSYALTINFVRELDLAIHAYNEARKAIIEFPKDRQTLQFGLFILASGYFEQCIDLIRKAVLCLKAIKSHKDVPLDLKRQIQRGLKVLSGGAEKKCTEMRHAIQHLEEKIQKGEIVQGQSLSLFPKEKSIELGNCEITYVEIFEWLGELNEVSELFANYFEKDA